jgi:hypothetical protein
VVENRPADVICQGEDSFSGEFEEAFGGAIEGFLRDLFIVIGDSDFEKSGIIFEGGAGDGADGFDPLASDLNANGLRDEETGDEIAGGVFEPAIRRVIEILEELTAVDFSAGFEVIEEGNEGGVVGINSGRCARFFDDGEGIGGGEDGREILGEEEFFGGEGIDVLRGLFIGGEDVDGDDVELGVAGGR